MERLDGFAWGDAAGDARSGHRHRGGAPLRTHRLLGRGDALRGLPRGPARREPLRAVRRPCRTPRLRDNRPARRTASASPSSGSWSERQRNDVTGQLEALRDLGAFPPDVDVAKVIVDLGLDRPPLDPMQLSVEQLTAEMRELTKRLLGYGARMPKELMLFVKDLLFFDGAMALMAPDVDLLAEIMKVVVYFHAHHGERIAREIGVPFEPEPVVDLEAMRAPLGSPRLPVPYRTASCSAGAEIRGRFEDSRSACPAQRSSEQAKNGPGQYQRSKRIDGPAGGSAPRVDPGPQGRDELAGSVRARAFEQPAHQSGADDDPVGLRADLCRLLGCRHADPDADRADRSGASADGRSRWPRRRGSARSPVTPIVAIP